MARDFDFQPGQIWTFKGAKPSTARIIIGAVPNDLVGLEAVIIVIKGASLPDHVTGDGRIWNISSAPMDRKVLADSVVNLEGHGDVPEEFAEGYAEWRRGYDTEGAGVFTIRPDEVVGLFWESSRSVER
jgi:hypothetical protein